MNLLGKASGLIGGLLILVVYVLYVAATAKTVRNSTKAAPSDSKPTSISANHRALGVASCAAQACHGSAEAPLGPAHLLGLADPHAAVNWKSSYFTWTNHDRHASAYKTLENKRSADIMHRLGRTHPATHDADCLVCHANPTLAKLTDDNSALLHTEGVGCEACHGNAERWRTEHTAWSKSTSRDQLYPEGMVKLYDLGVRAETCAGCHIGSPAAGDRPQRDVNHDLIAAGHPRLLFEYATFLRNMPPHWTEKDRSRAGHPARPPGYEAQVWLIGQAANAEASLNLCAARAEAATPNVPGATPQMPWPEFAEFNCFACHHNLQPDSWRRQPGHFDGPKIGGLSWNLSGRFPSTANDDEVRWCLEKTRSVETKIANSEATAALAKDAAHEWRRLRDKFTKLDGDVINQTVDFLRPDDAFWKKLDWDQAARLYTGVVAVENARRDVRRAHMERIDDPAVEKVLADLFNDLRLPRELGKIFDSPKTFTPDGLRDEFMKLFPKALADVPRRNRRRRRSLSDIISL